MSDDGLTDSQRKYFETLVQLDISDKLRKIAEVVKRDLASRSAREEAKLRDAARMAVIARLRAAAQSEPLRDFLFWAIVQPAGWSEPTPGGPVRHRAKRRWTRGLR